MKKIFLILCLFTTLFIVSCASTPEDTEADSITAPENEDLQNSEEDIDSEKKDDEDSDFEGDEDDVILLDDEEFSTEYSDDFPLPEEFEEPLVLTIDAPLEEESEFEGEIDSEIIEFDDDDLKLLNPEETEDFDDLENSDENESDDSTDEENPEDIFDDENQDDEDSDILLIDSEEDDGIISVEDDDIIDVDNDTDETKYIENEEVPVPSRKVTLKKNEYVEITYPGTGWIFLGLTDGSRDIAYYGTKLGSKDTKFTLQARKSGTKILHFYKSDVLTNEYIDDYVEVEVKNEDGSNKTHVTAPEFKMPVPQIKKPVPVESENQMDGGEEDLNNDNQNSTSTKNTNSQNANADTQNAGVQNSSAKTSSATKTSAENQTTVNTNQNSTAEENSSATENSSNANANNSTAQNSATGENSKTLLQEANILYNEKEFSAAKKKLDQYFQNPDSEIDRAYFLLGQVLEAKSPVQNIKAALTAYTNVTKNYPASVYWEDANKRIIYLKRFYLEAR